MRSLSVAEIDRELGSRSLYEYVRLAFGVVHPRRRLIDGWVVGAICEHLQAVTEGEIERLIISIPPRFMKSLISAVFWPSWEWTRSPETQWIFGTHKQALTTRDSVKCRNLIESEWYQERWGDAFQLASDQNQKMRFDNTKGGHRIALSVPSGTGEGGDRIVCDDPLSAEHAQSQPYRERATDWWTQTMTTRGNDEDAAFVVIAQRLHEDDLTGYLLEQELGYEHLRLPMEYDGTPTITSIGWSDPRKEQGELLHPERFGRAYVEAKQRELLDWGYSFQFQQKASSRKGHLIEVEKIGVVDEPLGEGATRIRWWDKAATEGGGDWTVGLLMAHDGIEYRIEDMVRGQWGVSNRDRNIKATILSDGRGVTQWGEQEGGSSGKTEALAFRQSVPGYAIFTEPSSGSKEVRARPFASSVGAERVSMVRAAWNKALVAELRSFPRGANDDIVDCCSGAHDKLTESVGLGVY